MPQGTVLIQASVPVMDLFTDCIQVFDYGDDGVYFGMWRVGAAPLLLEPVNPKFRSYATSRYDELQENCSVPFSFERGISFIHECIDDLCIFLERLCNNDAVSQWLIETDKGHPVAYCLRDKAVVNMDVCAEQTELREPLTDGVIELFVRLGIEPELANLGEWGSWPQRLGDDAEVVERLGYLPSIDDGPARSSF